MVEKHPIMLLMSPTSRLPAAVRSQSSVVEVVPGVSAIFGRLDDEQAFRTLSGTVAEALEVGDDEEDLVSGKELVALGMLMPGFNFDRILSELTPNQPFFTNEDEMPVAVLLLAPSACRALLVHMKKASLIAAFPAATRIIWSAIDTPANVKLLRALCTKAVAVEEEILSTEVFRFDGDGWKLVAAGTA